MRLIYENCNIYKDVSLIAQDFYISSSKFCLLFMNIVYFMLSHHKSWALDSKIK